MKNRSHLLLLLALLTLGTTAFAATKSTQEKEASTQETEADSPKPDKDGWYNLFNGKDLTGWKKSEDNPDTFKVVDGVIVVKGPRCHLFYEGPVNKGRFNNFEWKCEILVKPNSNSGMYFHTKYQPSGWPAHGQEVQINNTHPDPRKTGSLYRENDIMNDSPAKDNEWFTQHVIVNGRHAIVKINDKVVNDHVQPKNPEREAGWENNVMSSGTFALQGHDPDSEVHFRKIMVKPLPDKTKPSKKTAEN